MDYYLLYITKSFYIKYESSFIQMIIQLSIISILVFVFQFFSRLGLTLFFILGRPHTACHRMALGLCKEYICYLRCSVRAIACELKKSGTRRQGSTKTNIPNFFLPITYIQLSCIIS